MNRRTTRVGPATAAAAALAAALASAAAGAAGIDFAQLDHSSSSSSLVLVKALGAGGADAPAPLLSATATRWTDGQAVTAGVMQRWTALAAGGHALRLGLGAGLDHFRSRAAGDATRRSGASLRAQAEADGAIASGADSPRYYLLAQGSSFRNGWFVTGQLALPAAGTGIELSRYGDESYHATTAALRLSLGAPGWSLRLGAVRDTDGRRAFVGIGYNGF